MHLEALLLKQKVLFPTLKNFKNFYLAGGTALAMQIGHRVSVDFDLFSDKKISSQLIEKCKKLFSKSRIKILIDNKDELTILVDDVKFTFLHYPFPPKMPLKKYGELKFLSPKEIAASKAYSIGRRGTFKDYVDLYFIFKEKYSTLRETIDLAEKKYGEGFNGRLFLEQLLYLEDINDTEISFLRNKKAGKNDLKTFFSDLISKEKSL